MRPSLCTPNPQNRQTKEHGRWKIAKNGTWQQKGESRGKETEKEERKGQKGKEQWDRKRNEAKGKEKENEEQREMQR